MFERFTERARQVIILSQEEARDGKLGKIDTACLLAGLIREEEGIAARVLSDHNITLGAVQQAICGDWAKENAPKPGSDGKLPFTDAAHKVLELSLRQSLQLGHNYISTEHILLGMVEYHDTPTCETFKLDESIRANIIILLRRPRWQDHRHHQQSEWAKTFGSGGRHSRQKVMDDLLKSATRAFNAVAEWIEKYNAG